MCMHTKKRSHTQVKDLVVHARVRWTMETNKQTKITQHALKCGIISEQFLLSGRLLPNPKKKKTYFYLYRQMKMYIAQKPISLDQLKTNLHSPLLSKPTRSTSQLDVSEPKINRYYGKSESFLNRTRAIIKVPLLTNGF